MTKEDLRKQHIQETGHRISGSNYLEFPYVVWLEEKLLKWTALGHTPEKWLEVYTHYQDLLTKEDTASWWQEQYEIANKERKELKEKLNKNA